MMLQPNVPYTNGALSAGHELNIYTTSIIGRRWDLALVKLMDLSDNGSCSMARGFKSLKLGDIMLKIASKQDHKQYCLFQFENGLCLFPLYILFNIFWVKFT